MAEIRPDQSLLPSVFDRLLDDEPDTRREPAKNRSQILSELRRSVRRDLENLLNTRVRCVPWPAELNELKVSLVSYGIPDMTGAPLGTPREREEFCRTIQSTISLFDHRLKKLNVRLIDQAEPLERTIRFQIEAMLQAEPAPEPLLYESTLRLSTGTFEVLGKGDRDE
jgi:type VI secretion system protein ImpF